MHYYYLLITWRGTNNITDTTDTEIILPIDYYSRRAFANPAKPCNSAADTKLRSGRFVVSC